MAKLDQFKKLVTDFADSVDFVTVYVQEAHATDGWELKGNDYSIAYHQSIDHRLEAAKLLLGNGLNCPLVMDNMKNTASFEYAAMPESLYIVSDGIVRYQGLGPYAYDPAAVRDWISSKVNKKK